MVRSYGPQKRVSQMSMQVIHLARREEHIVGVVKGTAHSRPLERKRRSNFQTRMIANAALQLHRRPNDWPNFLTHECVFQMSLQVTHLARRGARRGRSGARRKIHKGSARPRARKRWSNFLTLVIANTALQLCRGSDGWSNLLTREGVHRPRRLLAPHCSFAGEQRLAQLSDPQGGFPGESASQASCQAAGARRERSVVKSEIHNGTSRPRGA